MDKIEYLNALKKEDIDPQYIKDCVDGGDLTPELAKEIIEDYTFWLDLNGKVEIEILESQLGKDRTDPIEKQGKIFTWGSPEADKKFDPIQEHHHSLIAGNRGGGKSTWSFYIACQNAALGHKVLYLSLEMNTQELIIASCRKAAGISKEQWRDRSLITDEQKTKYYERKKFIEGLENLELIGSNGEQDNHIDNILKLVEGKNSDLVFADNLDLMRCDTQKDLDRQAIVSKKLMDFTNQRKIPIIVLHHINKAGDIRGNKKIEDNADLIFVVARNMPKEGENQEDRDKAEFNAVITKSRDFGEFVGHKFYFDKGEFKDYYKTPQPGFDK